ncbi:hypothetical protein NQZ71_15480 [Niallia taxi]|uniref:hypothetical protein n=1 Tax=Niallia taxi TaxID=2499688 RepID=UPI0021A3AEFE|nr:hypothetical protein [Niallia taxi]MCT2344171.1 hypothetical protein [Niallia taxi]MDE5051378.1 hypothetical protein [Niallia taxi]WOD62186.1 hypothetical protein NQZ71_15480 [Niallia taxi]
MRKILLFCIPALFLLNGCNHDVPDPEVKEKGQAKAQEAQNETVSAVAMPKDVTVHTLVKGNNLYVDCKAATISFREDSDKETGKIMLSLDGKPAGVFNSAAFVVRNVATGQHHAHLKIVNNKGTNVFEKEFNVIIN